MILMQNVYENVFPFALKELKCFDSLIMLLSQKGEGVAFVIEFIINIKLYLKTLYHSYGIIISVLKYMFVRYHGYTLLSYQFLNRDSH